MNRKSLLFLCLILCLFNPPASPRTVVAVGTDIFVSADGSGTSCTQDAPCLLADAYDLATDGDKLYFWGGGSEYTGTGDTILVIDKVISLYGGWDGSPTGPIVLDPQTYTTTFNGQSARRAILVDCTSTDPEQVTIIGFHFIYGKTIGDGGAISIKNGGVIVEGNQFHFNNADNYGGAIYVDATLPAGIENNLFTENQADHGGGAISVNLSKGVTPEVTIEGNRFSGGSAAYGTAIHVSNASVNITRNLLTDVGGNSAIILSSQDDPPSKIVNNVIANSNRALRFSNAATGNHLVWNNTIVDCDEVGIDVSGANIELKNNIIMGCDTSINVSSGSITGSHNLFYNNMPPDPNPLTDNKEDTAPQFIDPASDDYHLSKYSEAIDAGTTVDLWVDFDGDERPSGSGYDIGADEVIKELLRVFLPLIQR